ncbi:SPOR domain-containing protein [Uliginosibacterium paludis]|uniref:SPOR domain-containing protein n=1 Tax=Uliginosibacterium paludis TaxID=1615952 RepID=UPI0031F5FC7E
MSDADAAAGRDSGAKTSLITQAVVLIALIAALLAALVLSGKSDEGEKAGKREDAALLPRVGVAVSISSSSLSAELNAAVQAAPDVTQTALTSSSSSDVAHSVEPKSVPEESSDVALRISDHPASSRAPAPVPVAPALRQDSAPRQHTAKPAPVEPEMPPGVTGFALQLGVFSNAGNAEALQKKLKRAGIQAQLETRVQIGPFRTREEAVRTQEKLRKIGMSAGMMVPLTKKVE